MSPTGLVVVCSENFFSSILRPLLLGIGNIYHLHLRHSNLYNSWNYPFVHKKIWELNCRMIFRPSCLFFFTDQHHLLVFSLAFPSPLNLRYRVNVDDHSNLSTLLLNNAHNLLPKIDGVWCDLLYRCSSRNRGSEDYRSI